MKTLYVGCALTGAPNEFLDVVTELKMNIGGHFKVVEFVGLNPNASAQEVYETDIECAESADVMLGICDYNSTGLGMEIQKRIEHKKPTIIAHRNGQKVSRMVLGPAETYDYIEYLTYSSGADLAAQMKKFA